MSVCLVQECLRAILRDLNIHVATILRSRWDGLQTEWSFFHIVFPEDFSLVSDLGVVGCDVRVRHKPVVDEQIFAYLHGHGHTGKDCLHLFVDQLNYFPTDVG